MNLQEGEVHLIEPDEHLMWSSQCTMQWQDWQKMNEKVDIRLETVEVALVLFLRDVQVPAGR